MSGDEGPLLFRSAPGRLARGALRAFARQLRDTVTEGSGFLCLLTNDSELRRLNRQFRGKDYPADVLSFPEPGPDGFLGEVAVSVERAAEQARDRGHSTEKEIEILMLHGVLHLLGMDHAADRGRMKRTESRWRKHFGLPAGLIERSRS
jgi:probable rRNA maturation factor